MDYKNIDIDNLKNIVEKSNSFVEVTNKLGFNSKNLTIKRNIERIVKRNKISTDHFESVKRLKDSKNRYDKKKLINLVESRNTFKDVLLDLDLLPIESNYKTLKKYFKIYNIDYSKFGYSKIINENYKNEKLLRDLIINSNTLKEVLDKLKLPTQGNNYGTLKKYIKLYNIDISHFKPNFERSNKLKIFNKKNIEYYLQDNLKCSTSHLKERLYKEGFKKRECELCGQNETWKNKKMSLILDHINGKNDDNRIENLRIVCPNCNATLDTHCGKNHKQRVVENMN